MHMQEFTLEIKNGVDEFPYGEVFKLGGFVRVDNGSTMTFCCKEPVRKQIMDVVKEYNNPAVVEQVEPGTVEPSNEDGE